MSVSGYLLIGSEARSGTGEAFRAINPATGDVMEPAFASATPADVDSACALAAQAFGSYRAIDLESRAKFLEAIADNIMAIGDTLLDRCEAESGLPRARLEGERGRTVGQLRFFAGVVRDGGFLEARIDPAQPDRKPMPRVDLRLRNVPLGPVAVFAASNFPLAFSVAGGDTASAFAAGCPVVVKAHSAHPGTSELVGRAVQKAVRDCGLHAGVFSLLFDSKFEIGLQLVADPRITAVGFTGSRAGGTALMKAAASRPVPVPVYAEMSSINPVILFPHALAARGPDIARAFVGSLTMGAGQFCTNPGLIIAVEGPDLDRFLESVAGTMGESAALTMLTPGIHGNYCRSVEKLAKHPLVTTIARGRDDAGFKGQAGLFLTNAADFMADPHLQEEVFGASGLVVRCPDFETVRTVIAGLEGQLTAALHIDEADYDAARALLPVLEGKAGRILVNGFGTGVEVCHSMVHGGPYPSTSDGRSTSVGSLAINRFLRPVSYQDFPETLLPEALTDANPLGLWRRVDGVLRQP